MCLSLLANSDALPGSFIEKKQYSHLQQGLGQGLSVPSPDLFDCLLHFEYRLSPHLQKSLEKCNILQFLLSRIKLFCPHHVNLASNFLRELYVNIRFFSSLKRYNMMYKMVPNNKSNKKLSIIYGY